MTDLLTIFAVVALGCYCLRLRWRLWLAEKMLRLEMVSTASLRWKLLQAQIPELKEEEWEEFING